MSSSSINSVGDLLGLEAGDYNTVNNYTPSNGEVTTFDNLLIPTSLSAAESLKPSNQNIFTDLSSDLISISNTEIDPFSMVS